MPPKGEAISSPIKRGVHLRKEILDHIPSGVVSIERQVFTNVLGHGLLGYEFLGYWWYCARGRTPDRQRTFWTSGGW
jgi:hypothetical protein